MRFIKSLEQAEQMLVKRIHQNMYDTRARMLDTTKLQAIHEISEFVSKKLIDLLPNDISKYRFLVWQKNGRNIKVTASELGVSESAVRQSLNNVDQKLESAVGRDTVKQVLKSKAPEAIKYILEHALKYAIIYFLKKKL
ncbi:hypothetical protein NYE69_26325 [Paenibacillus sp. FSL R5-0527]|uniref:hypothetical protein n=1 Tax=Paenibacillus sp. FSL R5-0527 TaxID=2975321 RepID=UPI0030F8F87B